MPSNLILSDIPHNPNSRNLIDLYYFAALSFFISIDKESEILAFRSSLCINSVCLIVLLIIMNYANQDINF